MLTVLTPCFKSIEVDSKEGTTRVDEGMKIKFVTMDGEIVSGTLDKLSGTKVEKVELQIVPDGQQKKEIWAVELIAENSLQIIS